MTAFAERLGALPVLGVGVSTEYGAVDTPGALNPGAMALQHPEWAGFLEVGIETARGLDQPAEAWVAAGRPVTYHFLDVNLDEPEDFDAVWLDQVRTLVSALRPAWMCGDAGLWHFGPRDRGHMLLLPPILSDDSATAMARGIRRLRDEVGLEVLPENPPGSVYLGDLHLLEYYARICERADTGFLLDCAHLAIYQRTTGHQPLDGFDALEWDRVVEMHVAGAAVGDADGYRFILDDHTPDVLPDTWTIFEAAVARARNLRAVVFECERNPLEACREGFARIEEATRPVWKGPG